VKLGPFALPGYYVGDCRGLLAELPDDSVHCVVTSPPYWALRDYGLPPAVWGGDKACPHAWGPGLKQHRGGPSGAGGAMMQGGRSVVEAHAQVKDMDAGAFCENCAAWRGQLGLEPSPSEYVEHLVDVFQEVRRVLRADGTAWVNLGDTYAAGGNGAGGKFARERRSFAIRADKTGWRGPPAGLKPKDLCMIPARFALALQTDGWWLRDEIIWHKPNPQPSSVTDRTTRAHEVIYLFAKSERYAYDAAAVAEPATWGRSGNSNRKLRPLPQRNHHQQSSVPWKGTTRNKRSVWTIATQPTQDAHFATFPRKLVEPCILAGCPAGGVVLDPFGGSGTVGRVAEDLGRKWLLFDLSPEYQKIADRKTAQRSLLQRVTGGAA
jgi:DNA modification methylase